MNRGLIVGAGVIGVALAVLLIRLPGGGTEGLGAPQTMAVPSTLIETPEDDGMKPKEREGRMRRPRPNAIGPDGKPAGPMAVRDIPDEWKTPGPNPKAAERQKLRDTPEGHAAANHQAPFSRAAQLLRQSGNEELANEATDVVRELREYRVFPDPENFPELKAHVESTAQKIRDAGLDEGEMSTVLDKIDEHMATYEGEAAADPGEGEAQP